MLSCIPGSVPLVVLLLLSSGGRLASTNYLLQPTVPTKHTNNNNTKHTNNNNTKLDCHSLLLTPYFKLRERLVPNPEQWYNGIVVV